MPRRLEEGNGGGGGGRGGGGGGGVLELKPPVRAGDWGLLSEKPELELDMKRQKRNRKGAHGGKLRRLKSEEDKTLISFRI